MLMDTFLTLIASLEDNGALINFKEHSPGEVSQLKLVCDKQTYDIITEKLSGLVNPISSTKSQGLCFTFEVGEVI